MKRYVVSVIIPYFKKKEYIIKTLNSIFNQTYKYFEVILIYDDKNLEDYYYIKKKFKHKKNLKIVLNDKNLGAGLSRNKGIKFSKAKYISFCDSDDLWKKNKLNHQIHFMEKNNISLLHSSYNIIDKDDKKLGEYKIKKKINYHTLIKSCDIGLSTVILKRKLLKNIKFSNMRTKEDYLVWLELLKKEKFIYGTKKVLASWRKTDGSLSSFFFQKVKDAYFMYNSKLEYNFFSSIYYVIRLSYYALLKKIKIFIKIY